MNSEKIDFLSDHIKKKKKTIFTFSVYLWAKNQFFSNCNAQNQRRLDSRHVTIFYQLDSSLNMLIADPENLPKARVVAVFFGFLSFVFNELSWNPSQWFDVKIFFLEKSSF